MKYQAIGNHVFILPDEPDTKMGSFIVPLSEQTRKTTGIVTSAGEQVKSVKVGDHVMFKKWEVTEVKIDGKIHFVLDDTPEHLLAIVN